MGDKQARMLVKTLAFVAVIVAVGTYPQQPLQDNEHAAAFVEAFDQTKGHTTEVSELVEQPKQNEDLEQAGYASIPPVTKNTAKKSANAMKKQFKSPTMLKDIKKCEAPVTGEAWEQIKEDC